MRTLKIIVAATVLTLGGSLVVSADPWKDESGHGKHGNGPYWAPGHAYGACEVEREWKDDGEYNEKVKCEHDDDHEVYYSQPHVIVPAQRPSINIIVPID